MCAGRAPLTVQQNSSPVRCRLISLVGNLLVEVSVFIVYFMCMTRICRRSCMALVVLSFVTRGFRVCDLASGQDIF